MERNSDPTPIAEGPDRQGRLARIRPVTLAETVYREIKQALMGGRFGPGEVLTIRDLAAELGTSTMPVREALQRLVAERGLILLPNRSTQVPALTRAKFEDLKVIRVHLESLAATMAAGRITPQEIEQLGRAVRRMEVAAEHDDTADFTAANQDFHFTIYRASRSEYLVPIVETLWLQIGPFLGYAARTNRSLIAPPYRFYDQSYHKAMIEAFRRGDAEAAGTALRGDLVEIGGWIADRLPFPSDEADGADAEPPKERDQGGRRRAKGKGTSR